MNWAVLDRAKPLLGQLLEQAKEWQPLLAGLLVLLAAIVLAAGIIKAAKIRAARFGAAPAGAQRQDLRAVAPSAPLDAESFEGISANLEVLRSILRSALSSLSSVDADPEAARLLCTRIVAFRSHFSLPDKAAKKIREPYAGLLDQFEQLQKVVDKGWSPSEASARLIQLNASVRALDAVLRTTSRRERATEALVQQG